MSKQKKKMKKQQNQMLAMNKRLAEDSFKLVLICCAFMLINTGVQMWYQAMEKDVADKQLEQAKKQYALDSLQYEQTARFMEEYKLLKERELKIDSLAGVSVKNGADAHFGRYKIELEKKDEYIKAMRKAANGR
jgi:hypothetical protein